jgi:S-adenosylmethionine-diacylglycerol 3-amino-3-carboxypropyl transferase
MAKIINSASGLVQWHRFCDCINYSACNEDSESEIEALQPDQNKKVICVTAGGGRVLNLLISRPKEIWAVDLNPNQNHLLELKIAGIRSLDYDDFLSFMGVRESIDRLKTYKKIRHDLSDEARIFFDSKLHIIEKGVLFQGNLELFLKKIAMVVNLLKPQKIMQLFQFEDIESQRAFTIWQGKIPCFRLCFSEDMSMNLPCPYTCVKVLLNG